MHKKLLSMLMTVALVGGLLAFAATPASADPPGNLTGNPPASLLPDSDRTTAMATSGADCADTAFLPGRPDVAGDDEGGEFGCGYVLSDRFDGTNSLSHLTVVATPDTTRVDWLICPTDFNIGTDSNVQQGELASCNITAGSDATPKVPGTSTVLSSADEAYDIQWDVPATLDGLLRDVLVLACVGDGQDVEGSGQNCRTSVEEDIFLDDAASGGSANLQSSSGEIFSVCTADVDDPTTGGIEGPTTGAAATDPCQLDFNEDGTIDITDPSAQAAIAARFKPSEHGDPIPNNGAVFRVTTSAEITDPDLDLFTPVASNTDIDSQDTDFADCTEIQTFADHRVYECALTEDDVPNNVALALQLENFAGVGAGACLTADRTCNFDSHWHFSSDRAASTIVSTFLADGDGSPAAGASCTAPDKEETDDLSGIAGVGNQTEEICVTDQFGDPFAGDTTLESAGVGGFIAGAGCRLHDHNADTLNEHCHLLAADFGTDGIATGITIRNTSVPGDQTLTICPEDVGEIGAGTGTGNPAPTGHGCADSTLKETQLMHWQARPQHVHLVYSGTGDPADPCHSGDTNKEDNPGDTETLLVCTFSNTTSGHNQVGTGPAGFGRLQWAIRSQDPGGIVASRFVGQPPSETDDATGQATATIEAFRPGNDEIDVVLQDDDGVFVSTATVTLGVVEVGGRSQCNDSLDNDGDGQIDFPADGGCESAADNDETNQGTTIREATNLSLKIKGNKAKGKAKSGRAGCRDNRAVTVRKKGGGVVGSDVTNGKGKYSVGLGGTSGKVFAKVAKKSFAQGVDQIICLGDKSRTRRA